MDEEKTTPEEKAQPTPEEAQKPEPEQPADQKQEPAPEKPTAPQEAPATDDTATLRADLARAQTERAAVLEAAKLGIDAKHIDYVLKLADLPDDGKPEGIQKALQKVLDDVPAFRATAPENRPQLRIGTKGQLENASDDALARAFGNTKKN